MVKTTPRLFHHPKIAIVHPSLNSTEQVAQAPSPRLVSFSRHKQLNFVNHSLWKIHQGYLRTLTCDSQGDPVPTGFWSVGDIVGYPIAQTYPYIAECLTTVEAEYLEVDYRPSRKMVLLQVRQSNTLLKIAHSKQAKQRLLQFICWLAERFGHPKEDSRQIDLKLTHQEIAESVGITRVTVTRLIKTLEQKSHIVWNFRERLVFQSTLQQCYVSPN